MAQNSPIRVLVAKPGLDGHDTDREAIDKVLRDQSFERVAHTEILEILHRNGSVDYAMAAAFRCAEAARLKLTCLSDNEFKRAVLWVPDFVVARDK